MPRAIERQRQKRHREGTDKSLQQPFRPRKRSINLSEKEREKHNSFFTGDIFEETMRTFGEKVLRTSKRTTKKDL